MKTIVPLYGRVLVRRLAEEQKTKGGLFIPESADRTTPVEAQVVAIGRGWIENGKRKPLEVKVGDRVLLGRFVGAELTLNGEPLLMIREDEIMGIIRG